MASERDIVTLAEVRVQGYRSCRDTTFLPDQYLTALIGINGAGKTNLLSAINLLRLKSTTRYYASLEDRKSTGSSNETVITAWFLVGDLRIGYRVRLFLLASNQNADEIGNSIEEWNFGSISKSKAWGTYPISPFLYELKDSVRFRREFERFQGLANAQFSQLGLARSKYFDEGVLNNPKIQSVAEKIVNFCRRINYYSASQFTDPSRCPSSFEINSDRVLSDSYRSSRGHVKFLHDLYTVRKENPDLYKIYEQFISKNELGLVSRLSWKEIQLSSSVADVKTGGKVTKVRKYKTLVIPKIQIGLSHITFNQLSEGTFKTLALIFYIMTDSSSCLLIEEPEVCVHHGLLTKIISTIKSYSSTKQIVFSTHSDLVLDQLEPKNVTVVTMTKNGTSAAPMEIWVGEKGRTALTNYLEESGTLGEYWRSGGLS